MAAAGFVRTTLGRYGEAIGDYDRIAELATDDFTAYYMRGYVYSKLDEPRRAIEDCGRAIVLDPGSIDARYQVLRTELFAT